MSANPFEIPPAHWQQIQTFIGLKAAEDGVTDMAAQVQLMQKYWLLLHDRRALAEEIAEIELELVEAAHPITEQAVTDSAADIVARRAAGAGGGRRT